MLRLQHAGHSTGTGVREYFTVPHKEYVTQNATGKNEANGRRAEGAVRQPGTHWVQHIVPTFWFFACFSFILFPFPSPPLILD